MQIEPQKKPQMKSQVQDNLNHRKWNWFSSKTKGTFFFNPKNQNFSPNEKEPSFCLSINLKETNNWSFIKRTTDWTDKTIKQKQMNKQTTEKNSDHNHHQKPTFFFTVCIQENKYNITAKLQKQRVVVNNGNTGSKINL